MTRCGTSAIKDACFQKICAERAGQQIDRVYLVHLNSAYVRVNCLDHIPLSIYRHITHHLLLFVHMTLIYNCITARGA